MSWGIVERVRDKNYITPPIDDILAGIIMTDFFWVFYLVCILFFKFFPTQKWKFIISNLSFCSNIDSKSSNNTNIIYSLQSPAYSQLSPVT